MIGCTNSSPSATGNPAPVSSGSPQAPGPSEAAANNEIKRDTFDITLPGSWRVVDFGSPEDLGKLREVWKSDPNSSSMLDQMEAAFKQGALKLYALEDASSTPEFKSNLSAIWLKADKPQTLQEVEKGNLEQMRPMMVADPTVTYFKANGSDAYCMRGAYKAPTGVEVHISSVVLVKGDANLTFTFACPAANAAAMDAEVDKIETSIRMH